MAATTSLSRIVLCNTATVSINHIRWPLFQGVIAVTARAPETRPPSVASSRQPASPHLLPVAMSRGTGIRQRFFLRKFRASLRPAVDVTEEVGQPRDHRVRLGA